MSAYFSIVVATRNRANRLEKLLDSLETLQLPAGKSLEVVVADNGSTDDTGAVIRAAAARGKIRLLSIFEPAPGKSRALNAALLQTSGDIIALTDDDCIPDRDWLTVFDRELRPEGAADCVGGRVLLGDPSDLPITILRSTTRKEINTDIDVFEGSILGCNMAVRREVFTAVNGYDITLGPGSSTRAVSEDMDFTYRIFKGGFNLLYAPNALVYHYHGRKTKQEETALRYQYAIGRGAFYCKHNLLKPALWWVMSVLNRGLSAFRRSATIAEKVRQIASSGHLVLGAFFGAVVMARYRLRLRKSDRD
jgi:glycosyltransferase involved in cell wall biosynthesis